MPLLFMYLQSIIHDRNTEQFNLIYTFFFCFSFSLPRDLHMYNEAGWGERKEVTVGLDFFLFIVYSS